MIVNADGVALKKQLAANPSMSATLNFQVAPIPFVQNGIGDFSTKAHSRRSDFWNDRYLS